MGYDVMIHGGGIHGVATALDCALRGLKVLLFDKHDFGWGASTNNSKLIHGGLRYLEQFRFSLVRESLSERSWLLKNAKGYVEPLPFLMPLYKRQKPSQAILRIGLTLYDLLASIGIDKNPLPFHKKLDREASLLRVKNLLSDGLQGAFLFSDAQMDDRRILFTLLKEAISHGVDAYNYCDTVPEVEAKIHFFALGAYVDGEKEGISLVRSKGVHLLLPSLGQKEALLLRTPQDGRAFFVIPWLGLTLLGTTDTLFFKNPEECLCEKEDVEYLMEAFFHYFPSKRKESFSPIGFFSGLRPLIQEAGKRPSDLSRSHQLLIRENQITLIGGKYTTFRRAAIESTDLIERKLGRDPLRSPLLNWTFPPYQVPSLEKALEEEKIVHLDDWYFRRTSLGLTSGLVDFDNNSRLFQKIKKISDESLSKEKKRCMQLLSRVRPT